MAPAPCDEKLNEWLFSECQEAGSKISALMALDERIIAISLTLLIGAATVAVANGFAEVLVGLPVVFAALICLTGNWHAEIAALGGYKAALEEHLASRVGRRVIVWESRISRTVRHNDAPILISYGVLLVVFAGTVVAATVEATHLDEQSGWREHPGTLMVVLTVVAWIVSGLAALVSFWSAGRAYDKAKRAAAKALSEDLVTFKLEHKDGAPADPPTLVTSVPNWRPGDTIPLGHRTLRVLEVRNDSDGGVLVVETA
jgi:hypothetical protein